MTLTGVVHMVVSSTAEKLEEEAGPMKEEPKVRLPVADRM